jgi:hypothetical protein
MRGLKKILIAALLVPMAVDLNPHRAKGQVAFYPPSGNAQSLYGSGSTSGGSSGGGGHQSSGYGGSSSCWSELGTGIGGCAAIAMESDNSLSDNSEKSQTTDGNSSPAVAQPQPEPSAQIPATSSPATPPLAEVDIVAFPFASPWMDLGASWGVGGHIVEVEITNDAPTQVYGQVAYYGIDGTEHIQNYSDSAPAFFETGNAVARIQTRVWTGGPTGAAVSVKQW